MDSTDGFAFSQAINSILADSEPASWVRSDKDKAEFKALASQLFWLIKDARKLIDAEIRNSGNTTLEIAK